MDPKAFHLEVAQEPKLEDWKLLFNGLNEQAAELKGKDSKLYLMRKEL